MVLSRLLSAAAAATAFFVAVLLEVGLPAEDAPVAQSRRRTAGLERGTVVAKLLDVLCLFAENCDRQVDRHRLALLPQLLRQESRLVCLDEEPVRVFKKKQSNCL
jgi:hypothetical protein